MEFPGKDMNAHLINLVRIAASKCTATKIPDFDEIRTSLGLDVKEGQLPPAIDGALEGKTIVINSRIQNNERKKFTQFHEVTHHLLNEDGELISTLYDATFNQEEEYKRKLEQLCNIGAAEFLMPRERIANLYKETGFKVDLIPLVADKFETSTIATTIQLAQVAPHACITAICEYGLIPNETSPDQGSFVEDKDSTLKKKLHVVYSASSAAAKYPLARNTRIPDDHPITQAFSQVQSIGEKTYIPFPSGKKMPCFCEALPDKGRVYAMFHLTPPPNPDQLTLF